MNRRTFIVTGAAAAVSPALVGRLHAKKIETIEPYTFDGLSEVVGFKYQFKQGKKEYGFTMGMPPKGSMLHSSQVFGHSMISFGIKLIHLSRTGKHIDPFECERQVQSQIEKVSNQTDDFDGYSKKDFREGLYTPLRTEDFKHINDTLNPDTCGLRYRFRQGSVQRRCGIIFTTEGDALTWGNGFYNFGSTLVRFSSIVARCQPRFHTNEYLYAWKDKHNEWQ